MSIYNAGTAIRLARKEAHLTQEKLSEGICSPSMLSQIENGSRGVSSSAFEALMSRTGRSTKALPCFSSREDFDCFYSLKRTQFYIGCWQLESAYSELAQVESHNWADNKHHYAEWLLLHCKIQFYSGTGNHENNYRRLLYCLEITHPNLDLHSLSSHLFSISEIEALTLLAQEALYTNRADLCLTIYKQIKDYLSRSQFSHMDKARLLAEATIAIAKYYISRDQYSLALPLTEESWNEMTILHIDMPLLQLSFLRAICLLHLEQQDEAYHLMKVVLYSAHGIGSCYFTICKNYLAQILSTATLQELFPLDDIPLSEFGEIRTIDVSNLSDGIYDPASSSVFTIGKLIRTLRKEQKLSADVLCSGLCSKSKLSKIENDQQDAPILLLEALLQRLGISERPFVFFGDELENNFNNWHEQFLRLDNRHKQDAFSCLSQMEEISSDDNPLQKQLILFYKSDFCTDPKEELALYYDALACTLPDFNINRILDYRLSWAELSILNNIAHTFIKTDTPAQGLIYFSQLISYYNTFVPDPFLRNSTYAISANMYCRSLYLQKHYSDTVCIFDPSHFNLSCFPIRVQCSFLFYYCQALGECKLNTMAKQFGNYAYAMQYLMGSSKNADSLKEHLKNNFSIELML